VTARLVRFNRGLTLARGLIGVAFGLFITFQTGSVDGWAVHLASLWNAPLKPVSKEQATPHFWG
jgi:hypothetical protein